MMIETVVPTELEGAKKVVETSVEVEEQTGHLWFLGEDVLVDSGHAHAYNISDKKIRSIVKIITKKCVFY